MLIKQYISIFISFQNIQTLSLITIDVNNESEIVKNIDKENIKLNLSLKYYQPKTTFQIYKLSSENLQILMKKIIKNQIIKLYIELKSLTEKKVIILKKLIHKHLSYVQSVYNFYLTREKKKTQTISGIDFVKIYKISSFEILKYFHKFIVKYIDTITHTFYILSENLQKTAYFSTKYSNKHISAYDLINFDYHSIIISLKENLNEDFSIESFYSIFNSFLDICTKLISDINANISPYSKYHGDKIIAYSVKRIERDFKNDLDEFFSEIKPLIMNLDYERQIDNAVSRDLHVLMMCHLQNKL